MISDRASSYELFYDYLLEQTGPNWLHFVHKFLCYFRNWYKTLAGTSVRQCEMKLVASLDGKLASCAVVWYKLYYTVNIVKLNTTFVKYDHRVCLFICQQLFPNNKRESCGELWRNLAFVDFLFSCLVGPWGEPAHERMDFSSCIRCPSSDLFLPSPRYHLFPSVLVSCANILFARQRRKRLWMWKRQVLHAVRFRRDPQLWNNAHSRGAPGSRQVPHSGFVSTSTQKREMTKEHGQGKISHNRSSGVKLDLWWNCRWFLSGQSGEVRKQWTASRWRWRTQDSGSLDEAGLPPSVTPSRD